MGVLQLTFFLLMSLNVCRGMKRKLQFDIKDWTFKPNYMNCLFDFTQEVNRFARIDNLTGLCDLKSDETTLYQVESASDAFLRIFEPVFEASNIVHVDTIHPVNYVSISRDEAMTPRFNIEASNPNGDSMYFDFNNKSGSVWLFLKIDVSSSLTITSVRNGSVWDQVAVKMSNFRQIDGNFTMKYIIKPQKLKIEWDTFEVLDLDKEFEPYESVHFYSNFSTCHRLYFTSTSIGQY